MTKDCSARLFVVCHKPSPMLPGGDMEYIQVGSEPDIPGVASRDNAGDNISSKNPNYCELTAQYWIWKNVKADFVGLFHYRRLPSFTRCAENVFYDFSPETIAKFGWRRDRILSLAKRHDVLLPPNWDVFPPGEPGNVMTPYEFHCHEHRQSDIDEALKVIHDRTPQMDPYARKALMEDRRQCFANVCVMRKDLFDRYSEWLFGILFELERRIVIPKDREQARVFGYLGERLIMVWLAWAEEHLGVRPWFAPTLPLGVFPDGDAAGNEVEILHHERVEAPILSVIVPVFNVEKYLHQCLRSICNQVVEEIEIICVDDGSTDSSPEILSRYAEIDERIRIVRQRNQGLGAARNRGLEEARGTYLAFVDGDDRIDRLAWYRSIRKAERLDLDFLVFDVQAFDDETGRFLDRPWDATRFSDECYGGAFAWRDIRRSPFATPCYAHNKIVRRSFWGDRRFPEGVLYEDAALHYDLMLSAKRIGAFASPYYFYRQRRDSIMTRKGPETLDHLKIAPAVWKRLEELDLQDELAEPFAAFVQELALRCRRDWPVPACRKAVSAWLQAPPVSGWRTWNIRSVQAFRLGLLARDSPWCGIVFALQGMAGRAVRSFRRLALLRQVAIDPES